MLLVFGILQFLLLELAAEPAYRCDYTPFSQILPVLPLKESLANAAKQLQCKIKGQSQCNVLQKSGWMKLHKVPCSFQVARKICKNEGAILASPTPDLKELMLEMVQKAKIPSGAVWTGIHSSWSELNFLSVEGTVCTKFDFEWAVDQPAAVNNGQSCLTMNEVGTISNVNCDDSNAFLCYKFDNKLMKMTKCGTVDKEYRFNNSTGHCYKFHPEPRSWYEAHSVCYGEGGHLAIIKDEQEAEVLKDILAMHPPESLLWSDDKEWVHSGFLAWDSDGKAPHCLETIKGESMSGLYHKFDDNQNMDDSELCGKFSRKGKLGTNRCENKLRFICEKDPRCLRCDNFNVTSITSKIPMLGKKS